MKKNLFDLTDRVAIVTGGATGLGYGMAEALKNHGCTVSIWGRRKDVVDEAAATLGVHSVVCDVTKKAEVEDAFRKTTDEFGRIHGMFANAGMAHHRSPSLTRTEEEWDQILDVNVKGVAFCCQVAAIHMVEESSKDGAEKFGRLVATSSLASTLGAPKNEQYSASKGAVNSLMRSLGGELAGSGITANAILPGFARSDMTKGLMENPKFDALVKYRLKIVQDKDPRYGEPEDFGGIATYLMSDASSYHTGDCFTIDGGFSLA